MSPRRRAPDLLLLTDAARAVVGHWDTMDAIVVEDDAQLLAVKIEMERRVDRLREVLEALDG